MRSLVLCPRKEGDVSHVSLGYNGFSSNNNLLRQLGANRDWGIQLRQESQFWYQRSQFKLLKKGKLKTKIFHTSMVATQAK